MLQLTYIVIQNESDEEDFDPEDGPADGEDVEIDDEDEDEENNGMFANDAYVILSPLTSTDNFLPVYVSSPLFMMKSYSRKRR